MGALIIPSRRLRPTTATILARLIQVPQRRVRRELAQGALEEGRRHRRSRDDQRGQDQAQSSLRQRRAAYALAGKALQSTSLQSPTDL